MSAQELSGLVRSEDGPVPQAHIEVLGTKQGAVSGMDGRYHLQLQPGRNLLRISALGFRQLRDTVVMDGGPQVINFTLEEDVLQLEQVVVTGTREGLSRKESPVAVSVLDDRIFQVTQALSLSEGLSFQPGLRVETNCSNCGFSSLRLNGLEGPYTQILVDGRPIFSALNGVYGLEQIPPAMIERVEVVRGGGSALYGANAIGGTVNIITRDPLTGSTGLKAQAGLIEGTTPDLGLSFHHSEVAKNWKSGWTLFGQLRNRQAHNANPNALYTNADGNPVNDDFSELPALEQTALGAKGYFRPKETARWAWEVHHLTEYRRGGNLLDRLPHEADIAEQLRHRIWGAQLSYEEYWKGGENKWSIYTAYQRTARESYYGGGGNSPDPADRLAALNYYGNTWDYTAVLGSQWVWNPGLGKRLLTVGAEGQALAVNDAMPGYDRLIDQRQANLGVYAQWQQPLFRTWTLLLGGRYDRLNLKGSYQTGEHPVNPPTKTFNVFNPRISLLWAASSHWRLRLGYATGFRAPQAFDEDLHLSTLGGQANLIRLADNLEAERSHSFNFSLDWDTKNRRRAWEVKLEGFYTVLQNAFFNDPKAEFIPGETGDTLAVVQVKRNAAFASRVYGLSLEWNLASAGGQVWQNGLTWNRALYDEDQEWFSGAVSNRILRAPEWYAYSSLLWPLGDFSAMSSLQVTGPMATLNNRTEELVITPWFWETGLQLTYDVDFKGGACLKFSAGVQNLFNAFQQDLEVGPGKDAAYVYGPGRPRTFVVGIEFSK